MTFQQHTDLQHFGLTHAEATKLSALPGLDLPKLLDYLKENGNEAVKMLKAMIPLIISDPASLKFFMATISNPNGTQPPVSTPAAS